jgi:1,2-diacylglycerol 3-alpha-glucosyltransferase
MITANVVEGRPEYEMVDGVHVYRVPAIRLPKMALGFNFPWLSFTFTPGNIKRIKLIIRKHTPQVLHLHNYMFDLAFSAVVIRRQMKLPLITTIHTYLKHPSRLINAVFYPIERIFLKYIVICQSDCMIAPDWNVQQYIKAVFGQVSTALIPYGIDLPPSTKESVTEIRERYHLDGKKVILSVGHLHEMRNRKDLIAAMPQVLDVFPNAVLLIAGAVSTHLPADLVEKLHIHDSVIFTGTVQHSEISALLELADLEAHWLDQDEPAMTSLGIASLEAMSGGKVVLAAANPDTYGKGVLKNGVNLVIVEPGKPVQLAQTIVSLLQDDARRAAIGRCASQTIRQHFSWDSICEQTLQVYRKVIQK